jgi:ankyrin repeat protein
VTLLEQFLKEDPAEANARTPGGNTPLHYAASTGEVATAKVLLARGAAIDPQDGAAWGGEGDTPLHRASLLGHLPMCRLLVESGADLEKRGDAWTPLHSAAIHGDLEMAEYLISKGASLSSRTVYDDSTPLHEAALCGQVDMAKLLLRHGADINVEGGHYRGPNGPVRLADEPDPKPTPLDKAVSNRQREMARFLVSRGARLGREKYDELQKLLQPANQTPPEK